MKFEIDTLLYRLEFGMTTHNEINLGDSISYFSIIAENLKMTVSRKVSYTYLYW